MVGAFQLCNFSVRSLTQFFNHQVIFPKTNWLVQWMFKWPWDATLSRELFGEADCVSWQTRLGHWGVVSEDAGLYIKATGKHGGLRWRVNAMGNLELGFRAARRSFRQGSPWQLPEVFGVPCITPPHRMLDSRSLVVAVFYWWHPSFRCSQCSWAAEWMRELGLGNQNIQEVTLFLAKRVWHTQTQTFHNGLRGP